MRAVEEVFFENPGFLSVLQSSVVEAVIDIGVIGKGLIEFILIRKSLLLDELGVQLGRV